MKESIFPHICMLLHRTYGILTRLLLIHCGRLTFCMETLLIHDKVAAASFIMLQLGQPAVYLCLLSHGQGINSEQSAIFPYCMYIPVELAYDWKYVFEPPFIKHFHLQNYSTWFSVQHFNFLKSHFYTNYFFSLLTATQVFTVLTFSMTTGNISGATQQ